MPTQIPSNAPLWHQGKRKDGVSNEALLDGSLKLYKENPDNFEAKFEGFTSKYGWQPEWSNEFRDTIKRKAKDELDVEQKLKDDEYNKLLTNRNNLQLEKSQLEQTADPDQKNLMVEWQERNQNNEAAIAAITDQDLSEFAALDATINNFELLFEDNESRQQYNKLRKDAERILKLANPSRKIEYRSDGLYVDGELAEPSIMDEIIASEYEMFGLAAATGIGVTAAKMSRWGRAFPGYVGVAAGIGVGAAEVIGASKLADYDRKAALKNLGLFMEQDYMNRRENEDLVLGVLGLGAGKVATYGGKFLYKGAAKFGNALLNLFNQGKFVDDSVIYTLARHGNIDPEQLKKDTAVWVESLGKAGDTEVKGVRRTVPIIGIHLTDEQVAMTSHMPAKKIKNLHPNDQQFLYFINTNPDATQALGQALKRSPELAKGFLLKATKERGRIVSEKLKESVFNTEQFNEIAKVLQTNLRTSRALQHKYFVDEKGDALFTNTGLLADKLSDVPAIKGSTELGRYINDKIGMTAGKQYKQISYDELVNIYRDVKSKFSGQASEITQNSLRQFENVVVNTIKTGDSKASKRKNFSGEGFRFLLQMEYTDSKLMERGLGKYLSKPDITLEETVMAFNKYNNAGFTGNPDYRRILNIVGNFTKQSEKDKAHQALDSIENGIILSSVVKNSVETLDGISGKMNTNTGLVIDFPSLAKDLDGFKPTPGSKAYKLKQYIDTTAKLYRNDIGILRAFGQPLQINPASGSSIATSVVGKARVEIASRLYELAQTALPGTKYEFASATKKPILRYFSDNPLEQKSFDDMIKFGEEFNFVEKADGN